MNDKINISVTGFYGTGSSAVLDLLKEYDDVQMVPYINISYEHIPFYYSGGLFDLCSLLTRGNTLYKSDKVIHNFLNSMKRLNYYDYLWFGSYQKLFGTAFIDICNEFVSSISVKRSGTTTNHIVKSRFSILKAIAQLILNVTKKRKVNQYGIKYIYDSDTIYSALISEKQLYDAAKEFTSRYMSLFEKFSSCKYKIFDHLIWAPEIDAFKNCFCENFKIIVVDRDPRDVYLFDQFIWNRPPFKPKKLSPHFPTPLNQFIDEWKSTVYKPKENKNALCIHFEDLVYNYDETVCEIESFLGGEMSHVKRKAYFDPNKSIENTQLFRCSEEWERIGNEIAKGLPEFIYDFPVERVPNRLLMFDH